MKAQGCLSSYVGHKINNIHKRRQEGFMGWNNYKWSDVVYEILDNDKVKPNKA